MSGKQNAALLKLDSARMEARIAHLATLVDPALPPYTRRAFSEVFGEGRRWLREQFEAAGLKVSLDAGGNLVGRLEGAHPEALPIAMGSHSDTVTGGGRYDGIAGVIAALEVAQTLAENGVRPRHPFLAVDFLAEEPSDYGPSCVGSRAIAGTLSAAMLDAANGEGETLGDALRRMGGDPERIAAGAIHGPRPFAALLEMHIEQGPRLESEGVPIGVVSGVVGIRRMRLHVRGQADHAGTTPMPQRRDALVGAAEVISLVNRRALQAHGTSGLVATIGHMTHSPNMANVVPASATLTCEARCASMETVTAFCEAIVNESREALAPHRLELEVTPLQDAAPAPFSDQVRGAIRDAAARRGYGCLDMQSGAGHDAMHIAPLCPAGMVFVPCRDGRSHAGEEFATREALARGAEVCLETVLALDRSMPLE